MLAAMPGCLISRTPDVACWTLDYIAPTETAEAAPRFGVVRVSQVSVRAPYGARGIAVLRSSGAVASDPCNEYAAAPGALLKGVVADALSASNMFKSVVDASSSAKSALQAEIVVRKLAIDCRTSGGRRAVAELALQLLDGREISALANGAGSADAADGNYGEALSRAVSAAIADALGRL